MPTAPNLVLFIGLHPLLVHLPIGFLILLAIVELSTVFAVQRRGPGPRNHPRRHGGIGGHHNHLRADALHRRWI